MAIVSKGEGEAGGGGGAPTPAGGSDEPKRTNLPARTAPIVGRKREFEQVVQHHTALQREKKPLHIEISGKRGVGASTIGIELGRRTGFRFPGGAWYLNLEMGADLAWADLAVVRSDKGVKNVREAAKQERELFGSAPHGLLILDGANSREELEKALPPAGEGSAAVFIVSESPTGVAEKVIEVSDVPPHAARRIADTVLRMREGEAVEPPTVRVEDGLGLTAGLAARAAIAYEGQAGPLKIEDSSQSVMRLIPLIAQNPLALELMLIAAVAHPVRLPIDALFRAVVSLREGRGPEPSPDDVGNGVVWLARLGILSPEDEQRVQIHPSIQEIARGMTQSEADLLVARTALAAGLLGELDDALKEAEEDPEGGVDLRRAPLHQLRALAADTTDELQERLQAGCSRLEAAIGLA